MKNKLSCIIVEDLPVAANFLNRCCEQSGKVEVLSMFSNVTDALSFLDQQVVDLIFLDVELPEATGFELIDRLSFSPKIILTTSKPEYAYDAFQYYVDDFMKKPFTYKRFMEAVERIERQLEPSEPVPAAQKEKDHFFIKVDHKLIKLMNDEILYIESMGDYVRFITSDKKLVTLNTMKKLEERMNPDQFIKVHRSYIVNINKIDDLQGNQIFIQKHEIPIGKAFREEIMKRLNIL
jgi:DNA-binding LytR/AlgR family response regulator